MEFSFDLKVGFIAGFIIGILVTIIASLVWFDMQDRKVVKKKEARRLIINAIGKLCASVDNAFAAYRMSSMNFESLKEILRSKIEEINTRLTSNIDILDPYYVKNIERFIEDQKSFLLNNQGKEPVRSGEAGIRSGSRGNYHLKEMPVVRPEKPEASASEVTMQTEVFQKKAEKPVASEKPIMLESLPLDKIKEEPPPTKEPAPPPAKAKGKKKSVIKEDVVEAFESGATARIPADEFKKYKMPKPITPFETVTTDKKEEKPPIDIAATKEFKVDTGIAKNAPPVTESPDDKKIVEEKTVYDMPAFKAPEDDKKSVKGTTVFDAPLDVEATQEFNIQDLIEKTKSRIKTDDKKKKADDNSLITGDDVMDQMDSLFGFGD